MFIQDDLDQAVAEACVASFGSAGPTGNGSVWVVLPEGELQRIAEERPVGCEFLFVDPDIFPL